MLFYLYYLIFSLFLNRNFIQYSPDKPINPYINRLNILEEPPNMVAIKSNLNIAMIPQFIAPIITNIRANASIKYLPLKFIVYIIAIY